MAFNNTTENGDNPFIDIDKDQLKKDMSMKPKTTRKGDCRLKNFIINQTSTIVHTVGRPLSR